MGAKIGVLLNCGQQSQFSKVRREFDAGRVNLDPPMTCADWPVPGNLTLLHLQTAYTRKPLHRCHGLSLKKGQVRSRHNLKPSGTPIECVSELSLYYALRMDSVDNRHVVAAVSIAPI